MPYVEITDIRIMRDNFKILASFDRRPGNELAGKYARKLKFNNNGRFEVQDGAWGSMWRSDADSLLHTDNIRTIKDMFKNAIGYMKNCVDSDKKTDETRKAIFQALRGLYWLAYQGYRTRGGGYDNLIKVIDETKKMLKEPLLGILSYSNNQTSLWFSQSHQVNCSLFFNQGDIYSNTQEGICFGMSMDWCRRAVIKGYDSFFQSSKDKLGLFLAELIQYRKAINKQEMKKYRDSLINDPEHRRKFPEREARVADRVALLNQRENEIQSHDIEVIKTNKSLFAEVNFRTRMQKKGNYQAIAQSTQGDNFGRNGSALVSEKIAQTIAYRDRLQGDITSGSRSVQDPNGTIRTYVMSDDQKQRFQKELNQINFALNELGEIPDSDRLQKLQRKYDRIVFERCPSISLKNSRYLSDPSVFEKYLGQLLKEKLSANTNNLQQAFMINFKCERDYAGIKAGAGHAMAIKKVDENKYIAMDPNFGEFECNTIEGLIFLYSSILCFYSLQLNITDLDLSTISLAPAAP